jgi:hypothetical protein
MLAVSAVEDDAVAARLMAGTTIEERITIAAAVYLEGLDRLAGDPMARGLLLDGLGERAVWGVIGALEGHRRAAAATPGEVP